ncbi:hypothetical protein L2E82_47075 [Cichorium intybus]|uniref:Uncharacterized protein n=1 Tax=Cichorium intybus TaxID=13427 RepID=A0ACB8YVH4_CICIN|nr:hypothetical protein L2E82_47075 [Cichorium intybus]
MASSGFHADVKALQKVIASRHSIYQHQHNKQMSCPAMVQLLSNTLYYKRFFPYYAFNVLGGLDSEGKGCVFTYDVVGSYERVGYSAQGSGATLITPFLDNHLKSPSPLLNYCLTLNAHYWFTYLNSDFNKEGCSQEEDMLLCDAQKIFGNRWTWTEIAKGVSGRLQSQQIESQHHKFLITRIFPLSYTDTDEIYAQATLQSVNSKKDVLPILDFGMKPSRHPSEFFCSTLTPNDTSTHGGFPVTRRAAEK